jgi:hypothetical protein
MKKELLQQQGEEGQVIQRVQKTQLIHQSRNDVIITPRDEPI